MRRYGNLLGHLHGYQAEIDTYERAFEYIHPHTHPEGWGFMQHLIGRAHEREGKKQLSEAFTNCKYADLTLSSYNNALQTLTRDRFPKLRLATLIDTIEVYLAQHNTHAAHQCTTEAFEILQDLLNAELTLEGKKQLQAEYVSLY